MLTTKYIFPLKTERPTFSISSESDLKELPLGEPFNLIIKGKDLDIPLEEIQGDCIVRQTGCKFPLLKRVWGKLSVDAAHSDFPELELVIGNCNLHEAHISIPKLKQIWGKFRPYPGVKYKDIQFAKTGNKHYLPKSARSLNVHNQYDVEKSNLEDSNIFCLNVENFDGEIPVRVIYGNLTIKASSPFFPFLECVFGDINIIPNETESRRGNENPKAEQPIFFPKLQRVFGRLLINKNRVVFPKLQQVGNLCLEDKCREIDLDALRWVERNIQANVNSHVIKLPALEQVNRSFPLSFSNIECPSLKYIGGNNNAYHLEAPLLPNINGYLSLDHKSKEFPSLQKIGGIELNFEDHFNKIPSVKEINEVVYLNQHSKFGIKSDIQVNHALFILDNRIAIDESSFYISASNIRGITKTPRDKRVQYSFEMFVALLKLRHSSFQNFKTRQLAREWPQFQGKHWESLIQKIETVWNDIPKYSIPAIFKIKNRNLRRFCFSFVGVEEIMNILEAERISTEGVEMDYFQYDNEGNEFKVKKHNVYELYRASIDKIPDLNPRWSWRRIKDGYVYAVKCWCTSTTKAHWLWVEPDYIADPLMAIASTFRIHANLIPHIKCLKRQGDLLICEMKEEVLPRGYIRPLKKEEYFSLLKAES